MTKTEAIHNWHQTYLGYSVFIVVELGLTYGFASLAIDRGNLWWYLLGLIFLIGSLQNFTRLIGKLIHGRDKGKKARAA